MTRQDDLAWRLVDIKTGDAIPVSGVVTTFRGERAVVRDWTAPNHSGSTGRVYVSLDGGAWDREFFPSVVGAMLIRVDPAIAAIARSHGIAPHRLAELVVAERDEDGWPDDMRTEAESWAIQEADDLAQSLCDYSGCGGPVDGSGCRHPRPEDEA